MFLIDPASMHDKTNGKSRIGPLMSVRLRLKTMLVVESKYNLS
jgi:hypothetical protein